MQCGPVGRLHQGGGDEGEAGVGVQRLEAAPERGADLVAEWQRLRKRCFAVALPRDERPRRLDQRERIALQSPRELGRHRRRDGPDGVVVEERVDLLGAQRADAMPCKPGRTDGRLVQRPAGGGDDAHVAPSEPADEEVHDRPRRLIDPLEVVDHDRERPVPGELVHEGQHRGGDAKRLGGLHRPDAGRRLERLALTGLQACDHVAYRPDERVQPRKRDVQLGWCSRRSDDADPGAIGEQLRTSQKQGLARTGVAVDAERRTAPPDQVGEEPADPPLVDLTNEHCAPERQSRVQRLRISCTRRKPASAIGAEPGRHRAGGRETPPGRLSDGTTGPVRQRWVAGVMPRAAGGRRSRRCRRRGPSR